MTFHAYLNSLTKWHMIVVALLPLAVLIGAPFVALLPGLAPLAALAVVLLVIVASIASLVVEFRLKRCPACRRHALGSYWKRMRWVFEATTIKLVPTHCRSCGADLRHLPYRPGRLWIPKASDET